MPLSPELTKKHIKPLLACHELIPRVDPWRETDLLADEARGRRFDHKWSLSAIILHGPRLSAIGFVIAYLRRADDTHPFDSVYIHRMAVSSKWQRRGIGTAAVKIILSHAFSKLAWLQNVSVQTNAVQENKGIIQFYERLGFQQEYHVEYPSKRDWLFRCDRDRFLEENRKSFENEEAAFSRVIQHPRGFRGYTQPVVFFSTTSDLKFTQFHRIFSDYNIRLQKTKSPVELTEPQVSGSDFESEVDLVRHPLKLVARFLTARGSHPFLVEDTMLFIEFFNRDFDASAELPGHDTKRWWKQMGNEGILRLLGKSKLRRARYVSQVGCYLERGRYVFARGQIDGEISSAIRIGSNSTANFPLTNPHFFHQIFVPCGSNHTLAEMTADEFWHFDYRRKCIEDLVTQIQKTGFSQQEFDFMF